VMAEFSCKNVWDKRMPVLYASHDQNGDWQMLCGGDEHDDDDSQILILHKEHLAERDPSLEQVFDLEIGWEAERTAVGSPHVR
jgi:hypothetical protein